MPQATAAARVPGLPEPVDSKVRTTAQGPACRPEGLALGGPSPSAGQSLAASLSCPSVHKPPSGLGAGQTPADTGASLLKAIQAPASPKCLCKSLSLIVTAVSTPSLMRRKHPDPGTKSSELLLGLGSGTGNRQASLGTSSFRGGSGQPWPCCPQATSRLRAVDGAGGPRTVGTPIAPGCRWGKKQQPKGTASLGCQCVPSTHT